VLGEEQFIAQMVEHFMENLPHNNQNIQVPDQASIADSVPPAQSFAQSFAQGLSQDVEVVIELPEKQESSMIQAQGQTVALAEHGITSLVPLQAGQQGIEMSSNEDQQNRDPASFMQPMVAKLCQLLTYYNIQPMPPQKGEKGLCPQPHLP
jgi:hypothetical protein